LAVEKFVADLGPGAPITLGPAPPQRLAKPPLPADLRGVRWRGAVDLQDNGARLAGPGELAEVRPDVAASDLRAVWMPGNHREWAFRIAGAAIPKSPTGKWSAYAVVRVEKTADTKPDAVAFGAGVYDNAAKRHVADAQFKAGEAGSGYGSYLIGTFDPGPQRDLFIAPADSPGVTAVWVDRVLLSPH
jgi:hypothetical protein